MEPIAASYTVEITLRGDGPNVPTNKQIEEAIEKALVDLEDGSFDFTAARAVSERTDR